MEKKLLGHLLGKEKTELSDDLEKELQHHWRNLVGVVGAYLRLEEDKKQNLKAEMQKTVAEHSEELQKISQELGKSGAENLNVRLQETLAIIKEMNFDLQEKEDYSLQKYREEKFARLKNLLAEE